MSITPKIKHYKKTVSSLNMQELLAVLNNSRLSKDERFVVELVDLYGKRWKEVCEIMHTDEPQIGRWLKKARLKILKQIFK